MQFGEYGDLRMVRTRQYKLVRRYYENAPCELIDLSADPKESQNCFGDPAFQPLVEQLTSEIDRYFERYQDPIKSGLRVGDLPQHNLSEALAEKLRERPISPRFGWAVGLWRSPDLSRLADSIGRKKWKVHPDIKSYDATATALAFPLGGIGTGNVSLGARGELRDWEIFNLPAKGKTLPLTFFAIRCQQAGHEPAIRVLEGPVQPPHTLSHGYHPLMCAAGLPRFKGAAPSADSIPSPTIDFEDPNLPVAVQLEAYTPLLPLNPGRFRHPLRES